VKEEMQMNASRLFHQLCEGTVACLQWNMQNFHKYRFFASYTSPSSLSMNHVLSPEVMCLILRYTMRIMTRYASITATLPSPKTKEI
jgi:hypothetical protein